MAASPLRVVVVTPRYPPFTGGIELHAEEVARRHVAAGIDVTLLTTDLSGELPTDEERDGVKIRRLPAWPRNRDFYISPAVYRELVAGDWDLLHVQGFQTLLPPMAMAAALRARLPYVVTFHAGGHSSRFRNALMPVQEHVLRPLLARAERLVALTPAEIENRSRSLRLPPDRFALIPNGSDLPPSSNVRRDPNLVASVGRLERYKGHHRVIAALPYVLRQKPCVRLWIAGVGPYQETLEQLAADLGVTDRVEIRAIPVEERARMATELSRVHVSVCLSEYESHGIAVLEALGQGCRVVVARAPGLIALADAGLAHGVELESEPEEVAAAILEELAQPTAPPPRLPTWDECAQGLEQLYREVVERRPRPPR
jgi:glycosyltransferase involved in cell wall biosynthesis